MIAFIIAVVVTVILILSTYNQSRYFLLQLAMVADLTEYGPEVLEIRSVASSRVKPMTYNNLYLSLPSLALGIIRIGQGLVCSVTG